MKSRLSLAVTATLLYVCTVTALPGCMLFDVNKMVKDMVLEDQRRQAKKLDEFFKAQQQAQDKQRQREQPQPDQQEKVQQPRLDPSTQLAPPPKILAATMSELTEKAINEFKSRNDMVMVMFVARGDVGTTISNIKDSMRTHDKRSFSNPYWVVEFHGEAIDTATHCGVVIGRWYRGGFPYQAPWERIMDGVLAREATLGTYLYSRQGQFIVANDGVSQMDALQESCFAGSEVASMSFESADTEAEPDPRQMPSSMQHQVLDEMAHGQTAVKDHAALNLKEDTLMGSACNQTLRLELSVREVSPIDPKIPTYPVFLVNAALTVTPLSGAPLQTALGGAVSRSTGVIQFTASDEKASSPKNNLLIWIFRNDEGTGWEGMIDGIGDKSCDDVRLTSRQGRGVNAFPKMTGDIAFLMSNPTLVSNSSLHQLYWLQVAEGRASKDAAFFLGKLYETRGRTSPQDYVRALQYYQGVATRADDARAQKALGRMYAKGLGTAIDTAKAKTLNDAAKKTRQSSEKACRSPKLRDAILRYSKQSYGWKDKATAEVFGKLSGIKIERGEVTIGRITARGVISLTEPFMCQAVGGFDDPDLSIKIWGENQNDGTAIMAAGLTKLYTEDAFRNARYYYTVKLTRLRNGLYDVMHSGISGIQSEILDLN